MRTVAIVLMNLLLAHLASTSVWCEEGYTPPATQADVVIQGWLAECHSVKSVRGDVFIFSYDHTWGTQSSSSGQFGHLASNRGFWKTTPNDVPPRRLLKMSDGESYRFVPSPGEHWRWSDKHFQQIDEEAKSFWEYPVDQIKTTIFDPFKSLEGIHPFLPGIPDKKTCEGFVFAVTRETEIEVELHAAPRPKTYFSRRFQSCDLILQKNPWRLSAVRYNQATNSQVVLVFSHIEFNPPLWDEPDLTGYKCLNPRGD